MPLVIPADFSKSSSVLSKDFSSVSNKTVELPAPSATHFISPTLPAAFTELVDGCSWLFIHIRVKGYHVLVWYSNIACMYLLLLLQVVVYCCFEDVRVQLVLLSSTVACCADRNGVCCKLATTSVPQCITMSPSN